MLLHSCTPSTQISKATRPTDPKPASLPPRAAQSPRLNGHLDAVITQSIDGARSCVQHLKAQGTSPVLRVLLVMSSSGGPNLHVASATLLDLSGESSREDLGATVPGVWRQRHRRRRRLEEAEEARAAISVLLLSLYLLGLAIVCVIMISCNCGWPGSHDGTADLPAFGQPAEHSHGATAP